MYPVDLVVELSRGPWAIRTPDQVWEGVIERGVYEPIASCAYAYTSAGVRYYRLHLVRRDSPRVLMLTENQDYDIITLPAG